MGSLIIITGVGRSGTSLLAKILHSLKISSGDINSKYTRKLPSGKRKGYFESIALGKAIHIWEWSIYGLNKWRNPLIIPIENKIRGPYQIRKLLFKIGDYILLKELRKISQKKGIIFLKRPNAIWWIWRINILCSKAKLSKPVVISCERKKDSLIDSLFEEGGTPCHAAENYINKYNSQIEFLMKSNRKITPKVIRVQFEDYSNNQKNISNTLSTLLSIPSEKILKHIKKNYQK